MVKKIAPYIAGPICWLVGCGLMLMVATMWWEFRMDTYFTIGFATYLSSAIATYLGYVVMTRLDHKISAFKSYVIIAIFSLVWMGVSVISSIYIGDDTYKYQLVSLLAAQMGSFTSLSSDIRNGR